MGLLLGLDDLIGPHIDLEFMAFSRLVHDLDPTEPLSLLVFAFNPFDQARLGRDRRPNARDGLVRRKCRGGLPCGGRPGVRPSGKS